MTRLLLATSKTLSRHCYPRRDIFADRSGGRLILQQQGLSPSFSLFQSRFTSDKTIPPTQSTDSSNVWKLEANDIAYWDLYLATRPNYSLPFFELMYDYHTSHGSFFDTALDVGTGCGQAIPKLVERFAHVIASDNNAAHITEARRRLAHLPQQRVSFAVCAGEDLAARYPAASVDFVAAAECMPLMDVDRAIAGFGRLLRPGGTLAMWFYGRPRFAEPPFVATCQPLLDRILDCSFRKVVSGGGPAKRAAWQRAMRGMNSWLDDVWLPNMQWFDVRRRKWNTHAELPFFGKEACDFEIEKVCRVEAGEEMSEIRDDSFWEMKWDFAGLKDFVEASFPGMKEMQDKDPEIQRLLKEIMAKMGGEGHVRSFTWPVVQVLAARTSEN